MMSVDIVYLLLLLLAVVKGLQKGLILAVFSLVGYILGLVAALKLAAAVANRLQQSFSSLASWWPFLSFILVFLAVVILIRLVAKILEASLEMALLGWLNKVGGVIFYLINYTLVYSILLFFLVKLQVISAKSLEDSIAYAFVEPWGPALIHGIGQWIPAFKDIFNDLERFFESVAQKIHTGALF